MHNSLITFLINKLTVGEYFTVSLIKQMNLDGETIRDYFFLIKVKILFTIHIKQKHLLKLNKTFQKQNKTNT